MQEKIAIDEQLGNVREYLEENGYETIDLETGLQMAAVIVVSGMDTDYLGDANIEIEAPIVDAEGLTEDEVLAEVERQLRILR